VGAEGTRQPAGDQLRTAGDAAEADRLDNLAKVALGKQMDLQSQIKSAQPTLDSQRQGHLNRGAARIA
jgi:hypothetical protein